MTIRLEDIPSIHSPSPSQGKRGSISGRRFRLAIDRRDFIRSATATGMVVGLWMVASLPPARRAFASHAGSYPYRIKPLPCPGFSCYDNGGNQLCDDSIEGPCCPSKVHPQGCVGGDDGQPHYIGWHKNADHGYANWDVRPNDCPDGLKDGWKWKVNRTCGPCVGCSATVFRCHDGFHYHNGVPENSICKEPVNCVNCGGSLLQDDVSLPGISGSV